MGGASPAEPVGTLLLVDDDASVLATYRRILEHAGHTIHTAANGADALTTLGDEEIDAVLSDVSMPGVTGVELLRRVREIDLDLPVILLTGAGDVASAAAAVELGALRYLLKPVDATLLADIARRAVMLRRMAAAKREALRATGGEATAAGDRAGLQAAFGRVISGLWMAFQPILENRSGARFGWEALMRSNDGSLTTPQAVLRAAERLDRLDELGRTIRRLVASQMAEMPSSETVFVNLHPRDLTDVDLADPTAPLSKFAHRVVLEVTERAALSSVRDVTTRIASLRELGYRIAIDDLGAGYAGLTSFAQLEPEVVKLDMSLVHGIDHETTKQKVVASLVQLCREMNLQVVAEGVETKAEHDMLLALGCPLVQGFFFGRPTRWGGK
jgi:EAL domain-containing protein (putative c-di-GMP-specific phosphodiesterase class I)